MLKYVNNTDSEFVRKHGRQALQHAAVRTAVPLFALIIDSFANTSGLFTLLAVIILIVLWLVNTNTGYQEIAKEKGELKAPQSRLPAEIQGQQSLRARASRLFPTKIEIFPDIILNDLKSDDDVVRLTALMKLEASGFMNEAIRAELLLLAQHDKNRDVMADARALLENQGQSNDMIETGNEKTVSETNSGMNETKIETLDRLLNALSSGNAGSQNEAMRELWRLEYSSQAILNQLEKIAISNSAQPTRQAALDLLDSKAHKYIRSQGNTIVASSRALLLDEIKKWVAERLIDETIGAVLARRYDFDKTPAKPALVETRVPVVPKPTPVASAPVIETPRETPPVPQPSTPRAPQPTLTERLLSQTSINIFLYLGAFLVIGAAMILAALVESTRLPILLSITVLFAGGAFAIKKRLPQPSFTLFIVFSFLLPIDASVMAQTLNLSGALGNAYWAAIFSFMTLVWGFSVWFYSARFFSVASFVSLALAFLNTAAIFSAAIEWEVFGVAIAALLGLLGVYFLKNWKDNKFAQPLFVAARIIQGIVLVASALGIINSYVSGVQGGDWIASGLTWVAAASFFAWSGLLFPFFIFPWASIASLLPVSWLILKAFNASSPAQIIGLTFWAAAFALASEFFARRQSNYQKQFNWPLLIGSVPLFVVAGSWGFLENNIYAFIAFLTGTIAYTALMILRPRAYVWLGALIAGIIAYFTLFTLPFLARFDVALAYQLLGASLLLLVPELFFKPPLTTEQPWRWPLIVLGVLVTTLSVFTHLIQSNAGITAVGFGFYAILFMALAFHFKKAPIGYLSTASLATTIVYALNYFNTDLWLPALTGLSLAYFLGGIFQQKEAAIPWKNMLRLSGLSMGAIISLVALITLKPGGGWYIILVGAMFFTETYIRPEDRIEWSGPLFLSIASLLIAQRFHAEYLHYYLLANALIWLGADLIYSRTLKLRRLSAFTRIVGGGAIAGSLLTAITSNGIHADQAVIVFPIYAVFFALDAWMYRQPLLGYAATSSIAIATFYALTFFNNMDFWLQAFTGLAVLYYITGLFMRKEKTSAWSSMLRMSGLGLGAVIALAALISTKPTGGWYTLIVGVIFLAETYLRKEDRMEASGPFFFSIATYLILHDLKVDDLFYDLLIISLIWLMGDMLFARTLAKRRIAQPTRMIGGGLAMVNVVFLLISSPKPETAALCFGVYAIFFAFDAWFYRQPLLGYVTTSSIAISMFYALTFFNKMDFWLQAFTSLMALYYVVGWIMHKKKTSPWSLMLRLSGLGLGSIIAFSALILMKPSGGWYTLIVGAMFVAETYLRKEDRMEASGPFFFSIATYLILHDLKVDDLFYDLLAISLVWLIADILFARTLTKRRIALPTRIIGGGLAMVNVVFLLISSPKPETAALCFGVYAIFFVFYAWFYRQPLLGYAATALLPLSAFFLLRAIHQSNWLYAIAVIAAIYYAAGYAIRKREDAQGWSRMLLLSGLGLGVINSLSAPLQAGLDAAIPVAIAATLFAAEAFARRNAWLAFPANLLYLESYFLILVWLNVNQPQFFSVGTALLGMLMHYLLTRAGSRRGAFLTGMFSQLVLLGTTYLQMFSTQDLSFFVAIFLEAIVVLAYGIVIRSRSLVITPIIFIVLSVFTTLYTALKGISTVILVGGVGLILLLFGIAAVMLRERITRISERFSEWNA